jgi:hypothetical protein
MISPSTDNPGPTCTLPCDARTIDGEAGCVATNPTPDENRFVAEDGKVYIAIPEGELACNGCAAICGSPLCLKLPPCTKYSRIDIDNQDIVWKREPFNKGVK